MKRKRTHFFSKRYAIVLGVVVLVMLLSAVYILGLDTSDKLKIVRNPIGSRLLLNWHSLRKLPNIIHVSYWFKESNIPRIDLFVSTSNLEEMIRSLPLDPETQYYGYLTDEYKHFVGAEFVDQESGYSADVDIRFRGVNSNNWDAEKKAIKIKFPKTSYYQGMRGLNLLLPYDRAYFAELLSSYRAEKFGLFSPKFSYKRLFINKRDFGVYLTAEPWSPELLAKNNIVDTNNIFSSSDTDPEKRTPLFTQEAYPLWKSYTAEDEVGEFPEMYALLYLIEKAPDDYFNTHIGSLLNLEKFYKWQIINTLAGSAHQSDFGNMVLLFKQETGLFELVPWDVNMYFLTNSYYENIENKLVERVLSHDVFFQQYNEQLNSYLENAAGLQDDIAYYDDLYKRLKADFYKDQAKLHNDITFDKKVAEYREMVVQNIAVAQELAALEVFPKKISVDGSDFDPAEVRAVFPYLEDISASPEAFVQKHSIFTLLNNQVVLPRGVYTIDDIIVIPKGTEVVIESGVTLRMATGASIVSYSPVTALGKKADDIKIVPRDSTNDPWGVFAVVNIDEDVNIFENIVVSGGSAANINGVALLSQFSLHNSKTRIVHSTFSNARSDDGLHVMLGSVEIENSTFENNLADAIDLDFVTDSRLVNNRFGIEETQDNNGDAIDFSGTRNTVVKDNVITSCGDKGLSIGEGAEVTVHNTIIANCTIGIAVKDGSNAQIFDSYVVNNSQYGLQLYNKKPEFISGGTATVQGITIWNNINNIEVSHDSELVITDSVVEYGYELGQNTSTELGDIHELEAVGIQL